MSAQRFRKKPVEIEAVRFRGSSTDVVHIQRWIDGGEYVAPGMRTARDQAIEFSPRFRVAYRRARRRRVSNDIRFGSELQIPPNFSKCLELC